MGCFVVAKFLLTSASRGPSAIAEPLVNMTFVFWPLKGRCHGNQFPAKSPTLPTFVALTFGNGLQYRNADERLRRRCTCTLCKQEGLAVASIARDDPSTLPGDDPFPRGHWTINSSVLAPACTANAMRGKLWWNLKPKLAVMRQCNSVTDRRTDRRILTS